MRGFQAAVACLICACSCFAAISSGLCDPYYVAIKKAKTQSYVGPGKNYKVACVYTIAGTPVIVTAKYDHWRKVRDATGYESWIHKSQLSTKRFVITISEAPAPLLKSSNDSSSVIAYVKKNVVMKLTIVRGNWCKVEMSYNGMGYSGWISKNNVFGVFDNETR
jgi:SH3-like domain-containing protein